MGLAWLERGEGSRAGEGMYGAFSTTRMMMQEVSWVFRALHYDCNILTDSIKVQNHEWQKTICWACFLCSNHMLNALNSSSLWTLPTILLFAHFADDKHKPYSVHLVYGDMDPTGRARASQPGLSDSKPRGFVITQSSSVSRPLVVSSAWCLCHPDVTQCLGAWGLSFPASTRPSIKGCPPGEEVAVIWAVSFPSRGGRYWGWRLSSGGCVSGTSPWPSLLTVWPDSRWRVTTT